MQAEDGIGSDSDFSIAEDDMPSRRKRTAQETKDVKPKIAKPAEYRHAINREALTDEWEDDVENMPDKPGKTST